MDSVVRAELVVLDGLGPAVGLGSGSRHRRLEVNLPGLMGLANQGRTSGEVEGVRKVTLKIVDKLPKTIIIQAVSRVETDIE